MSDSRSLSWVGLILFIIFAAILTREGLQMYLVNRLKGDWRAKFEVNAEDKNADQVNSLRLVFYPDGTVLYEIDVHHYSNAVDIAPNFSSSETGYSKMKRGINGTFKLKGNRVYAVFILRGPEETPFDPFVVDDVGTDYTTGKPFVKLSLGVKFVGDDLVVQGFENSPQITLASTYEGFSNPFRFSPSERRSLALQPQFGPETTSVQTFVGDKKVTVQGGGRDRGFSKRRMDKSEILAQRARQDAGSWDSPPPSAETFEPVSSAPPEPGVQAPENVPVREIYQPIERAEIDALGLYTEEDLAGMKGILKDTSAACEAFAMENNGNYPASAQDLVRYVDHVFCGETFDSFAYTCELTRGGYRIKAKDMIKNGVFVITTGGVLSQQQ